MSAPTNTQRVHVKKANNKRSCLAMLTNAQTDKTADTVKFEIFCNVPATYNGFNQIVVGKPWPSSTITLSKPSDDEECPISLEPIKDSKLEWLPPGSCFVKKRPELSKVTLACNHSFSALNLAYLWLKMDMRCPCCRMGHNLRAKESSIPTHIRAKMVGYVNEQLKKERIKDEEDSLRATQALFGGSQITGLRIPYSSLAAAGDLSISVTVYGRSSSGQNQPLRLICSVGANLRHQGSRGDSLVFSPSRNQLRTISDQLQTGAAALSLHIAIRVPGTRGTTGVYFDCTGIVSLESQMNLRSDSSSTSSPQDSTGQVESMTIPGRGGHQTLSGSGDGANHQNEATTGAMSNFYMSFDQSRTLTELTWIPNSPHMNWSPN